MKNNLDLSKQSSYNSYMMKTVYLLLRKDNYEYYGLYDSFNDAARMQEAYRVDTVIIPKTVKVGYTFEE